MDFVQQQSPLSVRDRERLVNLVRKVAPSWEENFRYQVRVNKHLSLYMEARAVNALRGNKTSSHFSTGEAARGILYTRSSTGICPVLQLIEMKEKELGVSPPKKSGQEQFSPLSGPQVRRFLEKVRAWAKGLSKESYEFLSKLIDKELAGAVSGSLMLRTDEAVLYGLVTGELEPTSINGVDVTVLAYKIEASRARGRDLVLELLEEPPKPALNHAATIRKALDKVDPTTRSNFERGKAVHEEIERQMTEAEELTAWFNGLEGPGFERPAKDAPALGIYVPAVHPLDLLEDA